MCACKKTTQEVGTNRLDSSVLQLVRKSKFNTARDFFSFCHVPVEPLLSISFHIAVRTSEIFLVTCMHSGGKSVLFKPQETATLRAPVKDLKSKRGFKWIEIELLEPFSVVQYLWNTVRLDVGEKNVQRFWTEHRPRGTPWALKSESTDFVPLGIYGDGCRIRQIAHQPTQKAIGIFLNCPIFRPNNARASRWLLCTVDENLLYKHVTLNRIYARIVWSLNCLWEDRFPTCGPSGEPLPERFQRRAGQAITGRRFQVVEVRGDWAWHKLVFRFNSSWQAGARKPVCFACPAVKSGECRYHNVTDSSKLWEKMYTHEEFLRKEMPAVGPSCLAGCACWS